MEKWTQRYEVKPGRWVYEPTDEARVVGVRVRDLVAASYRFPKYFFHLRGGGHVAALKLHLGGQAFIKFDLADFFGHVNKNRVIRCLKPIVGFKKATELAEWSTVRHPDDASRRVLPYGFCQSTHLASMALNESRLGAKLRVLSQSPHFTVSIYVDDILISAPDPNQLKGVFDELIAVAHSSRFTPNAAKSVDISPEVIAFNARLAPGSIRLTDARMSLFRERLPTCSPAQLAGITSYVLSVNPSQLAAL